MKKLSVVVPFHSSSERVPAVLDSLLRQKGLADIELIIVANPRPVRGGDARVLWLHSASGVGRARNLGADHATSDWIYFLDGDCELSDEGHLLRVIEAASSTPDGFFFGGEYLRASETTSAASRAYQDFQERWVRSGAHGEFGWIHFLGGNLVLPRSVFARHHFDPSITFGGSETDLVYRLLLDGYRGRLDGSIPVVHRHELTLEDLIRKAFLQGYSQARFRSELRELPPERKAPRKFFEDRAIESCARTYDCAFRAGMDRFNAGKKVPGRLGRCWWALWNASFGARDFLRGRRARLDRMQGWLHAAAPSGPTAKLLDRE